MVLMGHEISKNLRCIQLSGLNLQWQLFSKYVVTLFECASEENKDADTKTSHFTISLVLLPLRPLTKLPLTPETQHYTQYRQTLFLKSNVFGNGRYLHAWDTQPKQMIYLHLICLSVCEEDCICILYTVETLIFQWFSDKFDGQYSVSQKTKMCSIKLYFLDRSLSLVTVQ